MPTPLVLIHGYSDKAKSFARWEKALEQAGYDVTTIHTCEYETLTNEVTLKDIAEGFDRALRIQAGLDSEQEFDAIVHSTGMLVIRAWLAAYAKRRSRLKHLIALAPASFGSPLAHKGRSWLGALFKGRKELGPDFMEAGDQVLDGLELASRFTWDLAHQDLIGPGATREPRYGPDGDTPYVFTFCGDRGYPGLRRLVNEPGTDGTVRWAGCPLNTRKISMDLTVEPGRVSQRKRFRIEPWVEGPGDLIPVRGATHGSVLGNPHADLITMVKGALRVSSQTEYQSWLKTKEVKAALARRSEMKRYQQFVVRVVDERSDPVTDYNLELFTRTGSREQVFRSFSESVHVYKADASLRCFHVALDDVLDPPPTNLWLRIIASSGSRLVNYHGFGSEKVDPYGAQVNEEGKWDAEVDISDTVRKAAEVKFFYPFTTTLVEVTLNREPMPLSGKNTVFWFVERSAAPNA